MAGSDQLASTNTRPSANSVISTPRSKRLLVVDDESLIALMLSEQLVALGHSVIGPACTMSEALHLASVAQFDAALLDFEPAWCVCGSRRRKACPTPDSIHIHHGL